LSIPGRARPGRDHYAGVKTGASRHHSIATTTRYPVITGRLHMRTVACQGAARAFGALTSPQLPQLPRVRDVLARHAQRTSLQDRRTAGHARVARRSLPRGIPTSEQIGAPLNAQVLTEREMLQEDRRIPPSSLTPTSFSPR
jgi:hypothetical protein